MVFSFFSVYRETRDPMWLERGKQKYRYMKGWLEKCSSWNFEHKLLLMQAEESFSDGKFDDAKKIYETAISSAQRCRFINQEALAYELTARFYFEIGDKVSSLEHFRMAHEKYQEWGAFGKACQLFTYINQRFCEVGSSSQSQNRL